MTFAEYLRLVAKCQFKNPAWRPGQCFFNVLHDERPTMANSVRGNGMLDPFHLQDNIPAFISWVEEHWEQVF